MSMRQRPHLEDMAGRCNVSAARAMEEIALYFDDHQMNKVDAELKVMREAQKIDVARGLPFGSNLLIDMVRAARYERRGQKLFSRRFRP